MIDVDVQKIAAIAWRCIKECKDYEGPPVMCPAHQQEAKAVVAASHDETCHFGRDSECDCGRPAFTHCRMCGHIEVK
jgi:hypothetical protein